MRKLLMFLIFFAMIVASSACSQEESATNISLGQDDRFVFVEGGSFVNEDSNFYSEGVIIEDFYIGKYEVTQAEWIEVMGGNPSYFEGENLPVEMVSWYDAIEYCNARSMDEGLVPYYNIDKENKDPNNESEHDPIKWTVTINEGANGYRLPTEAEWEYAASGGQSSDGYTYSGSDEVDEVAWYWRNAGDQYLTGDWNWPIIENNHTRTHDAGSKDPNELGLFDMSGNVREWCWDWYGDDVNHESDSGSYRVVRGGGWIGDVSSSEISFRGQFEASGSGPDQGFRVVRDPIE
ncbi:SUMF1/EgtB/PvdO family nonheme iron enzyme [Halalkalibacter sp. APA_J-10(15)]|uniref:formylglycine-generating enzyme family protein n=1 Tax=Halalkalibacter sp. APA_J-10(15) TaxID=2933805 RepID=UPI001FF13EFD|nr:SUMF1/EgtB/PvdO family nonheme iron enzyme [Halalkalibacter sp. APA_J-10(15)]MCK0473190.1 formylglycine-generating enzyme family protein [Halalkalibacter sp. APA_J-10(15)]